MSVVEETCACGARFRADSNYEADTRHRLDEFRANHMHCRLAFALRQMPAPNDPRGESIVRGRLMPRHPHNYEGTQRRTKSNRKRANEQRPSEKPVIESQGRLLWPEASTR